ncbi:MAG: hypothetical protein U0793_18160 [Gemmataceae bacterium]
MLETAGLHQLGGGHRPDLNGRAAPLDRGPGRENTAAAAGALGQLGGEGLAAAGFGFEEDQAAFAEAGEIELHVERWRRRRGRRRRAR